MSLFRPDRVFVSLELGGAALVRTAARNGARVAAAEVIDMPLELSRPEGLLEAIASALSEERWSGTARHAILSDRLARYLVVERPRGIRSISELRLLVASRFEESFDLEMSDWEIAFDRRPFAQEFLACALPRSLAESIRRALGTGGRCASIRPFLVCEVNRCASSLPNACSFAAVARDSVAVASIIDATCRRIRVHTASEVTAELLASFVDRDRLLSGQLDETAPILATGLLRGTPSGRVARLDRLQWGRQPASWGADYRLALSEVWS